MTRTHEIKGLQDFVEPIKELIYHVINADYTIVQNKGWMSRDGLETIIDKERENLFFYSKLEGKELDLMEVPDGLFWLTIPPEDMIVDAISRAFPLLVDEAHPFFIEMIQKHRSSKRKATLSYGFRLGDILDNEISLPDSEWHVDLRMWTVKGKESRLTLKLEMHIKSGKLYLKIEGIEVM